MKIQMTREAAWTLAMSLDDLRDRQNENTEALSKRDNLSGQFERVKHRAVEFKHASSEHCDSLSIGYPVPQALAEKGYKTLSSGTGRAVFEEFYKLLLVALETRIPSVYVRSGAGAEKRYSRTQTIAAILLPVESKENYVFSLQLSLGLSLPQHNCYIETQSPQIRCELEILS